VAAKVSDREELEKIKRLWGSGAFAAEYLLNAVAPTDTFIPPDVLERAILKTGSDSV
jgi:hypothetical protein